MRPKIGSCGHGQMRLAIIGNEGMAKPQKKRDPPTHIIAAHEALVPFMQAFHIDSEKVAKELVSAAAKNIYGSSDLRRGQAISNEELDGIISLMNAINPQDSLETLYAVLRL